VFFPGFGEGLGVHGFRYAFHHNLYAIHSVCTFCNCVSHGFNMSIHGIIEHQNFSHFASLLVFFLAADRCVHLKISRDGQTATLSTISLIYNKLFNVWCCSKMKHIYENKIPE
jgi:hypothetical protein